MYKLIELLGDLLKSLFVPSEEKIQALIDTATTPFEFVETIKKGANSLVDIVNGVTPAPSINISIPQTKYTSESFVKIDFSWYAPYKSYIDGLITVFVYISFIWRLFSHLPHTISGNNISSSEE